MARHALNGCAMHGRCMHGSMRHVSGGLHAAKGVEDAPAVVVLSCVAQLSTALLSKHGARVYLFDPLKHLANPDTEAKD